MERFMLESSAQRITALSFVEGGELLALREEHAAGVGGVVVGEVVVIFVATEEIDVEGLRGGAGGEGGEAAGVLIVHGVEAAAEVFGNRLIEIGVDAVVVGGEQAEGGGVGGCGDEEENQNGNSKSEIRN